MLEIYDAITDTPVPSMYKELDKEYPNSKFILTIRNPEDWFESTSNHTGRYKSLYPEEVWFYGTDKIDKEVFIKKYLDHNAEVLDYFKDRHEDLLIMDICSGDGWQELCNFLDKPIPEGPFPYINKTIEKVDQKTCVK